MSDVKQIEALLLRNTANQLVQRCLAAMRKGTWLIRPTTGPLVEVRAIYHKRFKAHKAGLLSKTIEGFEELMPALDSATDAVLTSCSLETQEEHFAVFADSSLTKLFGILIVKNK